MYRSSFHFHFPTTRPSSSDADPARTNEAKLGEASINTRPCSASAACGVLRSVCRRIPCSACETLHDVFTVFYRTFIDYPYRKSHTTNYRPWLKPPYNGGGKASNITAESTHHCLAIVGWPRSSQSQFPTTSLSVERRQRNQ